MMKAVFANGEIVRALLSAASILLVLGIIDDRWGLDAPTKLAGQVLAGSLLALQGITLIWLPAFDRVIVLDPWTSVLLTVLLLVITVNAINFVDGVDGLTITANMFRENGLGSTNTYSNIALTNVGPVAIVGNTATVVSGADVRHHIKTDVTVNPQYLRIGLNAFEPAKTSNYNINSWPAGTPTDLPSVFYGTAIPTSGTYRAGDIVVNVAPALGGPVLWVCSVALSRNQPTESWLLPPLYRYPLLNRPPRAAYSHSASVGRRYCLPLSLLSLRMNSCASSQLIVSTGLRGP